MNKLFVYGTLRQGFSLHHYLRKGGVRYLGKGRIRGRLYDLGSFPGALPSAMASQFVEGEVYELSDPVNQLRGLDEIEEFYPQHKKKSLFLRDTVEVRLADGRAIQAWAYFLNKKPPKARLLQRGDFAAARGILTVRSRR